jgi:hypothetical protein
LKTDIQQIQLAKDAFFRFEMDLIEVLWVEVYILLYRLN